ncbi:MAG: hypothetical protein HN350_12680 [Phycisphaerales bacterium]|nr:hypothetical protein [Phycisphaerales bacterium]
MLANPGRFLYDSDMTDQTTESATPKPSKRWRKTKWFYGILLSYCVLTIVAIVCWSSYSHRKFRQAVDPIIAREEPLAWSDFATDPIPDDQNAAILYKQALDNPLYQSLDSAHRRGGDDVERVRESELMGLFYEFEEDPKVYLEHPREFRELLGLLREVFADCRKARGLDKVDWGLDYSVKPYSKLGEPRLRSYVQLANMLHLAVVEAHESGRDDDAVEYLRDIIAMGDALESVPIVIGHLVAIAVKEIGYQPLEEILPGLRIGGDPGCASPENIHGLMTEFMGLSKARKGLTLSLMGERSLNYDVCRDIISMDMALAGVDASHGMGFPTDSSQPNSFMRTVFSFSVAPALRIDSAWLVRHLDAYVRASECRTWPECRDLLQSIIQDRDERFASLSLTRFISRMLAPSIRRMFELHYYGLAKRQLAGVAIAVRMHQVDKGNLPDTLADLAPNYLADVPMDPMGQAGSRIRYINETNMPRLYSVGLNGRDDQGAYDDQAECRDGTKEILLFLKGRPSGCIFRFDEDD